MLCGDVQRHPFNVESGKPALADHWGDCCSDHLWRDCAWKAERMWDEDQQTRITVAHLH